MTKSSSVLRHIWNHMGVVVAGKFIPLAYIFFYSHHMSVADYGMLNLYNSYLWIFGIAMSLNLHTAIGRYIYSDNGDLDVFLATSLITIFAVFGVITLIIISKLAFFEGLLALPRRVILITLIVVVGSVLESIFTQIAIFNRKSSLLLKVVSLKAIGVFSISVGFLFLLREDKYLAILYAEVLVNVLLSIYVLRSFRGSIRLSFDVAKLKYMLHYSVPLIPYMLSLTLLSQFDRVMIDSYYGKADTGLYSLAYNAGILLVMAITAILNAFSPSFFESLGKKNYAKVSKESEAIFSLAVLATAFFVLFGEDAVSLITPHKYASALDVIPVVAIGGLSFSIFQIWVRVIAYVNRTYLISGIAIIAAALNIALNYYLLPIGGYKIAALTTLVAYLFMSIMCAVVLNKVIGLFKVQIRGSLIYIGVLSGIFLFFKFVELKMSLQYPLKVLILVLMTWQLKSKIFELLEIRNESVGGK